MFFAPRANEIDFIISVYATHSNKGVIFIVSIYATGILYGGRFYIYASHPNKEFVILYSTQLTRIKRYAPQPNKEIAFKVHAMH